MKKLITFIVSIFLTVPIIPQKIGDNILLHETCNLYEEPSILAKTLSELKKNDMITILQLEDKHGFYFVQYENIKGFLNASKIVGAIRSNKPIDRKMLKKIQNQDESFQKVINPYIKRYGKPDDARDYYSGGHQMRTFVWNCANGKYLSVDFLLMYNRWFLESEYTRDLKVLSKTEIPLSKQIKSDILIKFNNSRQLISFPYPEYVVRDTGTVVMNIWVNKKGFIIKAQIDTLKSTTNNNELLTNALNAAKEAKCNEIERDTIQVGTVTYRFLQK